jgi:NAD(P)-dependent dehydrogenase (short-subunit alcohol dehydrogenase family)
MSIVIVGAGPNLGAAIARRFGREGMPVGLVSRNREKLELLAEDLTQEGITADFAPADIRDATALSSAIGSLADRLGAIEVLEYSPVPAGEYMKPVLETTVDDVHAALEFSVLGAVAAVTSVIGPMLERGSGTILFTTGGAALNPNPAVRGSGSPSPARSPTGECSTTNFGIGASTSGIPRSAAASHQTETTNLTTSPTSSGATTPSAATSRSGSASTNRARGKR